jgi:two-component system, sensor histidine kinase and response regulator
MVIDNAQSASSKANILIVDDTPSNLRLLASMLTQQGYEVRSAISGSVALMAVQSIYPDLILLDINMPNMNGYEVCAHLKKDPETQDIPVIFLSALDDALDKVQAFRVGGVDYITKPFQVEEVLARVENQLTVRKAQLELQQAQVEALKALEKEKELNRLKSEFIAMVSHDFRTPLTSIQGFSELLSGSLDKLTPEVRSRYFSKINSSISHLLHLLDEFLLAGSMDEGALSCQVQLLDLAAFCHDMVEGMQVEQPTPYPIQVCFQGEVAQAMLDPNLLRQILTNLLSNAVKYSPQRQPIQLEIECLPSDVRFQVRDQGIGIPASSFAYLFDAFYRSKNVGSIQGTGLGLAIVKRCVEAHQGQIAINSTEGVGTSVTVTLPTKPNETSQSVWESHSR